MKLWIIAALSLTLGGGASAAPVSAPVAFPPGAEAAEDRISGEISPMLRAWARSEASYSTHVDQIGRDLSELFPQVQPGAQTDAVTFLVLMEMARVRQSAGQDPREPLAALTGILPRLGPTQDVVIKRIRN